MQVEDRSFWAKVRRNIDRIPFVEDAVAAYYAMMDRSTPRAAKALIAGALAYFVFPLDAIPDVLPALGFTDDAAVLAAALRTLGKSILPEHRDKARAWIDAQREKKAQE